MTLTQTEIADRWAAINDDVQAEEVTEPARNKYIRSLDEVGESLIDALRVEDGIGLGLAQVDVLTRGFRPSDLVVITGFAHSGKTQIINTMIVNNPAKRVLFFSLDDPAEMILAKLVAMVSGVSSEKIEARVREGDAEIIRLVKETARTTLPNLLVVDSIIGMQAMGTAVDEAVEAWGAEPDCMVIDYVEMMPGGAVSEDQAANIKVKMNDLKGWAKTLPCPLVVLHQGTRSNAKPGEPITLLSLGFSGEQQATIVIGCRRKRDKEDMDAWERQHHDNTITVHVVKNKRPGGKMTHYEGIDFTMDPMTGLISMERDPSSLLSASRAVQTSMEISA